MCLPVYLAMTAAEYAGCAGLPAHIGWMACHFSPYGTGLSNLPPELPAGSLLILNDRTPVCGHDPGVICHQLEECVSDLECAGVLLDFQRPDCPETAAIAAAVLDLPCPVIVSESYAADLDCPVFLPPPPLYQPLAEYLQPWENREIWLELAPGSQTLEVDRDGCRIGALLPGDLSPTPLEDSQLHCHYWIDILENAIHFHLCRQMTDLERVLSQANSLGVHAAVGLYQELKEWTMEK